MEAQAKSWHVYKALQRGGKEEKTQRPMFCLWPLELCRPVSSELPSLFSWSAALYSFPCSLLIIRHICRLQLTPWVALVTLFPQLSHICSVKFRMKGLDLVYFYQVNKSCCFGCFLTQSLSLKCKACSSLLQTLLHCLRAQYSFIQPCF